MKKFIICFLLSLFIFQKWEVIDSYLHPLPDYVSVHNVDVVIYVKTECRYCEEAIEFMESNDITYYEYNIERSSNGKTQYDSLGGKDVPLLLANGMAIREFDPEKILSLAKGSDGLLGRLGF